MKTEIPLLTILFLLVAVIPHISAQDLDFTNMVKVAAELHLKNGMKLRTEQKDMLLKPGFSESRLIALLDDTDMRTNKPHIVGAAITILGAMQSTNAVERIAKMLMFNEDTGRDFTDRDWRRRWGNKMCPQGYVYSQCPAWVALSRIGKSSIPILLEEISKGHWKKESLSSPDFLLHPDFYYAYDCVCVVLKEVEGSAKMYNVLDEYKKKLDTDAANRIDELIDFCRKLEETH